MRALPAVRRSLLGRIARHGVSGLRDPREDRLTEIVAALLAAEECEGLPRHVALGWLHEAAGDARLADGDRDRLDRLRALLADDDRDWACAVDTQVGFATVDGARRPDLELRFASGSGDRELLLWLEVKHGTAPHTGQLQAYADEQRARGLADAAVLLVAPRADYASFDNVDLAPGVPGLTWEQTARVLDSYAPSGAVGQFLVADLLSYLEEESLMDPPQLTGEHVAARVHHGAALDALHRICEVAAEEVARLSNGPFTPSSWPERTPREYWWSYPSAPGVASATGALPWEWNWELLLGQQRRA